MQNDDVNFELNLLPVISLLAVCISFLLLTAIWVNIGTLDIKQAIGETAEKAKDVPTLQIQVSRKGMMQLSLKNLKSGIKKTHFGINEKNAEQFSTWIDRLKRQHPELVTATVIPSSNTKYQALIRVFETLKKHEIKDIGVSPI